MAGFSDRIQGAISQINPNTPMFDSGGDDNFLGQALGTLEPYFRERRRQDLSDYRTKLEMPGQIAEQQRMRQIYDPSIRMHDSLARAKGMGLGGSRIGGNLPMPGTSGMNVVFDPGPQKDKGMTDYQKESIELEREKNAGARSLASDRAAAEGEQFKKELALKTEGLELEKKKNTQIYDTKNKELETKASEAQKKLEQAERKLAQDSSNAQALAAHRAAQIEATNSRHALEISRRDAQLEENKRVNDARIAELESRLRGTTTTQETTDSRGKKSTKTTTKAPNSSGDVEMIGPDGSRHFVPKDKVADARKNFRMQPVSERK